MWGIGLGVAFLLLAWYALASMQSNPELNFTVYYVALVILIPVCLVAGRALVLKARKTPAGMKVARGMIGLWVVLILGGELIWRYAQSQEALRQLESYPLPKSSDALDYMSRRDRILSRMGPFVSENRKQAVRDKRTSLGPTEASSKN